MHTHTVTHTHSHTHSHTHKHKHTYTHPIRFHADICDTYNEDDGRGAAQLKELVIECIPRFKDAFEGHHDGTLAVCKSLCWALGRTLVCASHLRLSMDLGPEQMGRTFSLRFCVFPGPVVASAAHGLEEPQQWVSNDDEWSFAVKSRVVLMTARAAPQGAKVFVNPTNTTNLTLFTVLFDQLHKGVRAGVLKTVHSQRYVAASMLCAYNPHI